MRCGLDELPDDLLTSLPRLATLDVARNALCRLPLPAKSSDLTRLFAAHNRLGGIEPEFLKLSLVELDLSYNELTAWPEPTELQLGRSLCVVIGCE